MKRKLLCFILALFFMFCTMPVSAQDYNIRKTLTSASQTLTGAWANLGSAIRVTGGTKLTIWFTVDINDSVNTRVRVLYYHTSGGTAYAPQILTPSASDIKIEPEYYELNTDADQSVVLDFGVLGTAYAQIQVMVGTTGASPGAITSSYYLVAKE